MLQIQRQIDNLPTLQDGVLMAIILAVGISSLMEDAVANATKKIYNIINGAEIDSILLEDYLGN